MYQTILITMFRLEIEAIDEGTPVQTSRCTLRISVIDVNDNAPFFPSYPSVTVPEGRSFFIVSKKNRRYSCIKYGYFKIL